MTEQQNHLKSIIEQQKTLISEINDLNSTLAIKKENFTKLQGIVEYLTSLGVTLDDKVEETSEETLLEN
jgi:cbb3-type cytochrome oxidase cytochrome c subunit